MYICEGQRLRTALSSMYSREGNCLWTAPYRMYIHEGQRLRTTLDCSLLNVHLRRTASQDCSFKYVCLGRELSLDLSPGSHWASQRTSFAIELHCLRAMPTGGIETRRRCPSILPCQGIRAGSDVFLSSSITSSMVDRMPSLSSIG